MTRALPDIARARILVTNDDGIHAPGLKALERIARSLSDDVWVVAPETEQSAASHSLTLRRPLRIRPITRRRFAVDGTPTDCVVLAVRKILHDRHPDLVLSGVNSGSNLGEDVGYSGTVAAAMEAVQLGVPSIAFSQERDGTKPMRWATAEHFAPDIVRRLVSFRWPRGVLMNVNVPDRPASKVTGIRACRQGQREAGIVVVDGEDPKGRPFHWIGDFSSQLSEEEGTDLAAVAGGAIAVTPLHLDFTHARTLEPLSQVFT
jgi:5'-nucleotidase